jgi:hypothetical protein
VKEKVLFAKIVLNCSPFLIQPPTFFIRPFWRFAAEFSAPLAGKSTPLLLVGKVLDEQKEKVLCGKTVLHCGPCLIQPSHNFYTTILRFAAEFSAPWLATALLSCLVSKVIL